MGGKVFKKRLIYGVVEAILPWNNFVLLLKKCFANVLKCKPLLKVKFKCVSVTMYSLVMSPYSCDFIKMEIDFQ